MSSHLFLATPTKKTSSSLATHPQQLSLTSPSKKTTNTTLDLLVTPQFLKHRNMTAHTKNGGTLNLFGIPSATKPLSKFISEMKDQEDEFEADAIDALNEAEIGATLESADDSDEFAEDEVREDGTTEGKGKRKEYKKMGAKRSHRRIKSRLYFCQDLLY